MSASSEGTSSVVITFDANYKTAALTNQILVAAVVFFTLSVIFILLLYIYTRRRGETGVTAIGAFVDLEGPDEIATDTRDNGLDLDVIKSLPVVVFESDEFRDGIECAVCLSEVADGEKARLLPNCNHGFHLECIDMWFCSHSTCPLCRNPLGAAQLKCGSEAPEAESSSSSSESARLPTNVLFWGNGSGEAQEAQTSTPTSSFPPPDGMLVIEMPRRVMEGFDSNEEMNSKIPTPISARLGSFRRLFGREKRLMGLGSSSSPGGVIAVDVEQGERSRGVAGRGSSSTVTTSKNPIEW